MNLEKTVLRIIFLIFLTSIVNLIYSKEIVTKDDGSQIVIYDNYTWGVIDQNDSLIVSINPKTPSNAVEVWDYDLDYDSGESTYDKKVRLYIHYWNKTDTPISGVKVYVRIYNSFHELVYEVSFNDEVLLKPGEKNQSTSYRYWEDNPYIGGEPFDKLWELAMNGTAKLKFKITKVAFVTGKIISINK